MIVLGAFVGYLVAHLREGVIFTRSGILAILAIVGAGVVGLLDDWIKVSRERNLGLTKRAKMLGLLAVAVGLLGPRRRTTRPVHSTLVVHPLRQRPRDRPPAVDRR